MQVTKVRVHHKVAKLPSKPCSSIGLHRTTESGTHGLKHTSRLASSAGSYGKEIQHEQTSKHSLTTSTHWPLFRAVWLSLANRRCDAGANHEPP
jgi:hypothetical protein